LGEASKSRQRPGVVAVLLASAYFAALPVAAQELACGGVQVHVASPTPTHWQPSVQALCDLLGTLPDVDRTATLALVASEAQVQVGVTLANGRYAERVVHTPEALFRTVEALRAPRRSPPRRRRRRPRVPQRRPPRSRSARAWWAVSRVRRLT
jgi:hypothetical protein